MQVKQKTQPYDTFDPVFDGSFEVPIDTEYNLPDYCPDIQKVLKCRVVPELSSYGVSEDTLRCEGVCDIRVLYLDAKGETLRCCDFTKEFSAAIKVKSAQEKAVAWVRASVEHITCRAVNARRLDLHLAVSLKALAVVQRQEQLTSGLEGEGIQVRGERRSVSQAVNALSHQFTLEDRLPLKNGKPPYGVHPAQGNLLPGDRLQAGPGAACGQRQGGHLLPLPLLGGRLPGKDGRLGGVQPGD